MQFVFGEDRLSSVVTSRMVKDNFAFGLGFDSSLIEVLQPSRAMTSFRLRQKFLSETQSFRHPTANFNSVG